MDPELTPPEIEDLLAAYALDAVDDDERDAVEVTSRTIPTRRPRSRRSGTPPRCSRTPAGPSPTACGTRSPRHSRHGVPAERRRGRRAADVRDGRSPSRCRVPPPGVAPTGCAGSRLRPSRRFSRGRRGRGRRGGSGGGKSRRSRSSPTPRRSAARGSPGDARRPHAPDGPRSPSAVVLRDGKGYLSSSLPAAAIRAARTSCGRSPTRTTASRSACWAATRTSSRSGRRRRRHSR